MSFVSFSYRHLLSVLTFCVSFAANSYAQTVLQPGDVVLTGFNTQDPDDFAFAPLVDLAPGTQLKFTDNGWYAQGGFRATEGIATYTVPASGIAKGTIVAFAGNTDFTRTSQFLLSTDGEQLLVYQGTEANPTFLTALASKRAWSDATSANTSALPPGLVAGQTAGYAGQANAYMSNAALRTGTIADLQVAFATTANWTGTSASRVTWPTTPLQVTAGRVPDATEWQALRDLYVATSGSQWNRRDNWLQGTTAADFATWFGVEVQDNDVVGITLNNNNLAGNLPASLAQLTQLRTLIIANHSRMTGPIPPSLGQLRQLSRLSLYTSGFTGGIPPELTGATNLRQLELFNNPLGGPLPTRIDRWTKLETLDLFNCRLTGTVPATIGQLLTLQSIWLNRNKLQGEVPVGFSTLPNLTKVILSENAFTTLPSFQQLPKAATTILFAHFNQLDFASLERNLTGPGQHPFAQFRYDYQASPTATDTLTFMDGDAPLLTRSAAGQRNQYQWERFLNGSWQPVTRTGFATLQLSIPQAGPADQGLYRVRVRNTWASTVELTTRPLYLDRVPYRKLGENLPIAQVATPVLTNTFAPATSTEGAIANVNYVRTYIARDAFTDTIRFQQAPVEQTQVRTDYFDGLGRPAQTVQHQESPSKLDLIQPVAYDALSRPIRSYLPYAAPTTTGTAGSYRATALYDQYAFYRDTPVGPGFASDGIARTGVPFSEQQLDGSPLNRVVQQSAPGEAWQLTGGHTTRFVERANTAEDSVAFYTPDYAYNGRANDLTWQGVYPAGQLWGKQTTDEQGNRTLEWTNALGQVVTKQVEIRRVGTTTSWLRTAYVYDRYGLLRATIPPKAWNRLRRQNWVVTPAVDSLLFRYRYDERRGRLTGKQVPGTGGETYYVYNRRDRPVLSQDAAQRVRKEWTFTKYDVLGRTVLTGLVTRDAGPDALQSEADATAGQWEQRTTNQATLYYSVDQAYPRLGQSGFSAEQLLAVSYYDDYNFDNDAQGVADAVYDPQYNSQFPIAPQPDEQRTTGLVTRTRTRVLGAPLTSPTAWLTTTTFYNDRAQPIQLRSTHALGGEEVATMQVDFTGKVLKSYLVHPGPNHDPIRATEVFTYDHAGRVQQITQQLDGETQPVVLTTNTYTEVGQLRRETLAPTTPSQQRVDYTYNIRGWLTGVNDVRLTDPTDLWGMELSYESGFTPQYQQYGGNISGQKWRSWSDNTERAYGYIYDPANRLLQADFVARAGGSGDWTAERQDQRLHGMSYDENGNILSLRRRGLLATTTRLAPKQYGPTDELRYYYMGNRLLAVDDAVTTNTLPAPAGSAAAPVSLAGDFQEKTRYDRSGQYEYFYDANGNLTQDRNKGISRIVYNHLNLPRRIEFGSGADSLVFRYTAGGQKVAKLVYQTGKPLARTDYAGAFQYEGDSLRFFPHAKGRVLRQAHPVAGQPSQVQIRYVREYSLKDHLGNLRVAYRPGDKYTHMASLELDPTERAWRENRQFDSLDLAKVRHYSPALSRTGGQYVARLNAATGQPMGVLKLLRVQKGDTVRLTAPGLYEQEVSDPNYGFSLLGFVATLLQQPQQPAPVGPDGRTRLRPLPFLGLGLGLVPALTQQARVPKGYARLLVFSPDSVLVTSVTRQLNSTAQGNYQELVAQVVVQQDGYVQAYVGNESDADVYFDDVQVQYRPGLVVQETHYDPWGLSLAGLARAGQPTNLFQYNGKEQQLELGLNWQDYGARHYDAQLGRWHAADALNFISTSESPYSFVSNNPIRFLDPDGNFKVDAETARRYPHLVNVLKYYLPQLKDNPVVMQAFIQTTGASKEFFLDMIQYGKGPTIRTTKPTETFGNSRGEFSISSNFVKSEPEILNIAAGKLIQFETLISMVQANPNTSTVKTLDAVLFALTVTVMHEATHRGLYKTNPARFAELDENGIEQGAVFEDYAFGERFSYRRDEVDRLDPNLPYTKEYLHQNRGGVVLQGMSLSNRYEGYFNSFLFLNNSSNSNSINPSGSDGMATGTGAKGMKKIR